MIASATVVATVTLTVTAYVVTYTDVRCPRCKKVVLALPGRAVVRVKRIDQSKDGGRSGQGPVVACHPCRELLEVISNRIPDAA